MSDKYIIRYLILRGLIMTIPALITMALEWLFDKSESVMMWLDRKLPDPRK